jgi:hypothetical protein
MAIKIIDVLGIVFAIMILVPFFFFLSLFQSDPNFKIYKEGTFRDPEKAKIHNIEAEKNITIVYSTCIPSIIIGILGYYFLQELDYLIKKLLDKF